MQQAVPKLEIDAGTMQDNYKKLINQDDQSLNLRDIQSQWLHKELDPDLLPRKRGRPKKGSSKSQNTSSNIQFMMKQLQSFRQGPNDPNEPPATSQPDNLQFQDKLDSIGENSQQRKEQNTESLNVNHENKNNFQARPSSRRFQHADEKQAYTPRSSAPAPTDDNQREESSDQNAGNHKPQSVRMLQQVSYLVYKDYANVCRDAEELTLWQTIRCLLRIHQPGLDFRVIFGRSLQIIISRLLSKNPPAYMVNDIQTLGKLAQALLNEAECSKNNGRVPEQPAQQEYYEEDAGAPALKKRRSTQPKLNTRSSKLNIGQPHASGPRDNH